MTRTIRIRRGLDLPISGEPAQTISEARPVDLVAVLGSDYVGLKPVLRVEQGDRVALGEPLLEDAANPGVMITSPASGRVVAVHRGERRRLSSLVIAVDGDAERSFESWSRAALQSLEAASVRQTLTESGLWTAFRTRPFGRVPRIDDQPEAIFVTAIDTNPLAPDPVVVVAESGQAFSDGLEVLTRLTRGIVYVCTASGSGLTAAHSERIETVAFSGPHPAGLVGTHVHYLHPVTGDNRSVWYVGCQDVIAIGRLFVEGRIDAGRIIAMGGPQARNPRLLRTRLGADLNQLLQDELYPGPCRVVSGSVYSGRRAVGPLAYLGRYHHQVSVLPEVAERTFLGWLAPGWRSFSASRMFLSSLSGRGRRFPLHTSQHGSPRAMVPIGSYERVMPLDMLITPLLRALLVGDVETARLLGCLELEEEDLALCSFVCCSKYEFGPALRDVLSAIERDAA
ncbi:MAG: Na(+)-translocating NADH-quinone reductase subunit A [Pseudomonadales bacterium]